MSYTVRLFVDKGFIDVSADSVVLRLDCADAQADLELHCPHKARDKMSSAVANGFSSCFVLLVITGRCNADGYSSCNVCQVFVCGLWSCFCPVSL